MNDDNQQRRQRQQKLAELRTTGGAYPNDFRRDALSGELHAEYDDAATLAAAAAVQVKVAGRLMTRRVMGKASFAHLQDASGQIQLFAQRDLLADYAAFKRLDIGDIIGAEGELFHTKTGELSVRATRIVLLAKALRPLPEKHHGLSDAELKYRRRYVDLIMSQTTRDTFRVRAQVVHFIREFLRQRRYMEVETPLMHPIPGGALARPFVTHHNALDMQLYLRIAPELYLKRLVVGGFERVFEIGRSFRNEGVSTRHNPEFTMLEMYCAYADYRDMMALTEELMRGLCEAVAGGLQLTCGGSRLDFAKPFTRMTLVDAIVHHNPDISAAQLADLDALRGLASNAGVDIPPAAGVGKLQMELFEKTVEPNLIAPTFITAYPVEVSPLSRRSDTDPDLSERFELFAAGREIANGFSELNDPEDQADRFRQQVDSDHPEAMHFDADYIRALEYGMPPTAGQGIGIDRLVMLLTNSLSIRDVLLFPHLRHEASGSGDDSGGGAA